MTKKEVKLVKKLSKLLKQLNCRSFLHHFGPKKYQLKQHLLVMLFMQVARCSLRRASNLLGLLGFKVPTFSAVCKRRMKVPLSLWEAALKLTSGMKYKQVAIDGTGFSRTNPSHHYVKRINRRKPVKSYAKMSALFDIENKKFCALRVRTKPRHDIRDAKYLLKRADVQATLFGDTAYDAEWLHQLCFEKGIQTQIKPRKNVKRGFYRKKQMKNYSEEKYHQRSLIESGYGSVKRKYGGNVLAKSIQAVRAELYLKAIAHNLSLRRERFSTKPKETINLNMARFLILM
jgi:transposase